MSPRPAVLFLCVHNAGKSQMAAALLRLRAGDAVDVRSAGTDPDPHVHDESARAVAELGADMSGLTPRAIDPDELRTADRVVILGADAQVAPVEGMRAPIERWAVVEPAEQGVSGLPRTRRVRDDIARQVDALYAELVPAG